MNSFLFVEMAQIWLKHNTLSTVVEFMYISSIICAQHSFAVAHIQPLHWRNILCMLFLMLLLLILLRQRFSIIQLIIVLLWRMLGRLVFHKAPNSDIDYGIFNVRVWSFCMPVHMDGPLFIVSSDGHSWGVESACFTGWMLCSYLNSTH